MGDDAKAACLFCRIVAGELAAAKVYEDEEILAFRDINPQAPVHVLLIPKEHIATLLDLTESRDALAGRLQRVAAELARKEGIEGGFRVVVNCNPGAGQQVYHLHYHLLGGRRLGWPPG